MGSPNVSEQKSKSKTGEDQNSESKPHPTEQPATASPKDRVEGNTGRRKSSLVGTWAKVSHAGNHSDERLKAQSSKTWYGGVTLRRGSKAKPVTEVAKESILAATDKASELVTTARGTATQGANREAVSPLIYLSRSLRGSQRSLPVAATSATSDIASESLRNPKEVSSSPAAISTAFVENEDSSTKRRVLNQKPSNGLTPKTECPEGKISICIANEGRQASEATPNWRAWFSRTGEPAKPESCKSPSSSPSIMVLPADNETKDSIRRRNSDPSTLIKNTNGDRLPRSWLGLWAASRTPKSGSADGPACTAAPSFNNPPASSEPTTPGTGHEAVMQVSQLTSMIQAPGWAFWLRSSPGNTFSNTKRFMQAEMVIADDLSQAGSASPALDTNREVSDKRPRFVNPGRQVHTSRSAQMHTQSEIVSTKVKNKKTTADSEVLKSKKASKNILLPPIESIYPSAPKFSLLDSFSRWWQEDKATRLQLVQNPPRIERALAIGIHGYFPAPLIRSVLGQPTGTSVRFADGAASAIQSWTSAHGQQCEVEKVALEGEGRILERVDLLWKLLLNWIDNIQRADFVMVACHSQGVPVAIMLIAKLIEFGCVNKSRIGVCAMAGINLGPFVDFRSRWIGGSAGELFEFAQPDSQVSRDYRAALATVLKFGTRIAYVGSIDDQLVSLEMIVTASLAVQNALDTTTIGKLDFKTVREIDANAQNPYILPFALRGMLEENFVRNELCEETMLLLRQFDEWKPSTKILKDVKFRLEGVRSKL
ncbi:MAG: hypothetical protein LQ341_000709 [Variospora aurantia]|nr:MAG: hypothetical protein LQ341_000709 [Variospora aurantia]